VREGRTPRIAATLVLALAITPVAATPAAAQDRDCSDFDSQAYTVRLLGMLSRHSLG
jgi:hypothetical protein